MDLSIVRTRDRLKPQREPYWGKVDIGQYLGFRPSVKGGSGTWIARWYDESERRNRFHSLGEFGDRPPGRRFGAALEAARAWFAHVSSGGQPGRATTVKDTCEAYAEKHPEAAARFRRHVYSDPVARIALSKLTARHLHGWRDRLANKPAPVAHRNDGKAKTRPRSASAINRDMTPLRAALNRAYDNREVLSDHAWRVALRPIPGADKRRDIYLTPRQRRKLISALPEHASAFVHGLCALPLRPGALAALTAGAFNPRTSELKIGKDKSGADRKITLPKETAALLRAQRRGKLPAAPLFAQDDGSAWNRHAWRLPINEAVDAEGLPEKTTAYALRHSVITDLIVDGVPVLTVAQLAGTSIAMIERHYGHLLQKQATAALAKLVL